MPPLLEALRDTAARALLGTTHTEQVHQMERVLGVLEDAYRRGPMSLPPELLLQRLAEVDSRYIELILRQRGYILFGGGASWSKPSEQDRLRTVYEARLMADTDVQAARSVRAWTDYGLGQVVSVVPKDPAAHDVWSEFQTARRNAYVLSPLNLPVLSDTLLTDGEALLLYYFSTVDGTGTVRLALTDEIQAIVCENDDPAGVPLWYARKGSDGQVLWYADWLATDEQLRSAKLPSDALLAEWRGFDKNNVENKRRGTPIVECGARLSEKANNTRILAQHVMHNRKYGRGWPMFTNTFRWNRAYDDALRDQLTLARAVATFLDKITVKGGSREIDNLRAQIESSLVSASAQSETNPAPGVGTPWLQNQNVNRERLPIGSAAGDAQTNLMMVLAQVSAGTGVPIYFYGRSDMLQNRSVADIVFRPWVEQMQRYQQFLGTMFADMAELVLRMAEEYPAADGTARDFETFEVETTLESPLDVDIGQVSTLVGGIAQAATAQALGPAAAEEAIGALVALVLGSLGVQAAETPAKATPEDEEPETTTPEGAVERVAEMLCANARAGAIEWQKVAEFAVAELAEGQ